MIFSSTTRCVKVIVLCALFMFLSLPAEASDNVTQQLNALGEAVRGRGIAENGYLLQLWQTVDGEDGSITLSTPNGMTCLMINFKLWEWVIWNLPAPGRGS